MNFKRITKVLGGISILSNANMPLLRKSIVYTIELLSRKADFQPTTTKSDKKSHPTIKIG